MKINSKRLPYTSTALISLYALTSLACQPLHAENTYALVIGIDNYKYERKLRGSVNDANDIEQALKQSGVHHITKLLDADASRDRIEQEWRKLTDAAKKGDRIILTYAGHGAQIKDVNGDEKLRGDPADTSDETFLLSGHRTNSKNNHREQLLDDELGRWFNAAIAKELHVLVVADSCHSGDSYRSIRARGASRGVPINQNTLPVLQDGLKPAVDELSNSGRFMFISANPASEEIREITRVNPTTQKQEHRGALSIAFAQALRQADQNRDGAISVTELTSYIRPTVQKASDKNQNPTFYPEQGNNIVFGKKQPTPTQSASTQQQVLVKVDGGVPPYVSNLPQIKLSQAGYDLQWNSRSGQVFNRSGDLVANGIQNQDSLGRIAGRKQLIDQVYELSKVPSRFVQGQLGQTEKRLHTIGDSIQFKVNDLKYPFLYQFNIAGNGVIQCFNAEPVNGEVSYQFKATPPVGNDTLVSIAVSKKIPALSKLVGSEKSCIDNPYTLSQQLPKLLKGQPYQINHVDIFVNGG